MNYPMARRQTHCRHGCFRGLRRRRLLFQQLGNSLIATWERNGLPSIVIATSTINGPFGIVSRKRMLAFFGSRFVIFASCDGPN